MWGGGVLLFTMKDAVGCCTGTTAEAVTTGTGLGWAEAVPGAMTATEVWCWAGTAYERLGRKGISLGWEAALWVDVDDDVVDVEEVEDEEELDKEGAGDMDEEGAGAVATVLLDDVGCLWPFPLGSLLLFLMVRMKPAFALGPRNGAGLAEGPRACGLAPVKRKRQWVTKFVMF